MIKVSISQNIKDEYKQKTSNFSNPDSFYHGYIFEWCCKEYLEKKGHEIKGPFCNIMSQEVKNYLSARNTKILMSHDLLAFPYGIPIHCKVRNDVKDMDLSTFKYTFFDSDYLIDNDSVGGLFCVGAYCIDYCIIHTIIPTSEMKNFLDEEETKRIKKPVYYFGEGKIDIEMLNVVKQNSLITEEV